jgi:hypothetical protein
MYCSHYEIAGIFVDLVLNGCRKRLRIHLLRVPVAENHRPLHDILQFTNVARPIDDCWHNLSVFVSILVICSRAFSGHPFTKYSTVCSNFRWSRPFDVFSRFQSVLYTRSAVLFAWRNAGSPIGRFPPIFCTRSFVPADIPFWWSFAISSKCCHSVSDGTASPV